MSRLLKTTLAVTLALVPALLVACGGTQAEVQVEPKVSPPVISQPGVLRVGLDLEYPPFAGLDEGREAGIDVDVAEALAARLGLAVETVQVETTRVAEALEQGEIDVAMSVPITSASLAGLSLAGSYVTDGPGFFVSLEDTSSAVTTLTVDSLGKKKVGAQKNSQAYWVIAEERGADTVKTYKTLREGMEALVDGEIDVLAGDVLVGAYIARDFDSVRFSGQVTPAIQYGVAVAADAEQLEGAVRLALDTLAAEGVLQMIRGTWVGDLPALETPMADQ